MSSSTSTRQIYLDNSATTPLDPRVVERMERARRDLFENAGSVHRGGQRSRVALEDARETIAAALGAEPKEIVLTSGGTEANNMALKGWALAIRKERGVWPAIVTDGGEHHAVLHPAEFLAELGAPLHIVPLDREGRVTPQNLERTLHEAIGSDLPLLLSIMHANNETGTINPIADLSAIVRERSGEMHTDAVQSFGKIACRPTDLGVAMMTISAHKIHGPKGIGALYVRKDLTLEPLLHGGAQERGRRAGTEPVELAVGFAEAARIAVEELEENGARIGALRRRLEEKLRTIDDLIIVTPSEGSLPTIVDVTFADAGRLDGEGLIVGMDIRGVAVSNGSACTSGSMQPSHVLLALGLSPAQAAAAVRFSLSRFTTDDDVDRAAAALADVVGKMRR